MNDKDDTLTVGCYDDALTYSDTLTEVGEAICKAANTHRKPDERWEYYCEFLEYGEDDDGKPDLDCQFIVNANAVDADGNPTVFDTDEYGGPANNVTIRIDEIASAIASAFNSVMGWDERLRGRYWNVSSDLNYWYPDGKSDTEKGGFPIDDKPETVQACIFCEDNEDGDDE